MSTDVLSASLTMFGDLDQLDENGLQHFAKAFKDSITPPNKISSKIEDGALSLAASACGYIFWTIFFVAVGILFFLAYNEIISWLSVGIMTIITGAIVLLMASLLYNRVNDFTRIAKREINSHIADYTENVMADIIKAVKNGIVAYADNRTKVDVYKDISNEDIEI